jgi:MoaA/NifB/PqqE/SkfB family radical SAM enzyme
MDMAWGQHITFYGKDKPLGVGISRPVEERTLVRYKTVAFSHFRSFRYGMLEKVGSERLTDPDTGKPWHYAGDSALFLPMMEMARNVAFHPKPLYCYNRETQANEDKQGDYFASQNSVRVRALPPALNDVPEWYPEKRLPPTQRWRVMVGLGCDLRPGCLFCYYAHKNRVGFREWPDVEAELVAGLRRGNRFVDFSGGEPTLIKDLPAWIGRTRQLGLIPAIITHGQRIEPMLEDLWAAGLDDILFSVHGDEADHNRLTRTTEGFGKLWRAMTKCAEQGFAFRTNTVLVDNYKGLPALARKLARLRPFISNFINFQASWEWAEKPEGEIPFQARVSSIAPYLREAIDILTSAGTCVNVRYFPFCLLKGHEPLVVNDAQVMSDPFEWDYDVMPKTFDRYHQAGLDMAAKKYAAADSCGDCAVFGSICQGPHKQYLERFGGEELEPYDGAWINDPLHFRAQADPRQLFNLVGINWGWHYERSV